MACGDRRQIKEPLHYTASNPEVWGKLKPFVVWKVKPNKQGPLYNTKENTWGIHNRVPDK